MSSDEFYAWIESTFQKTYPLLLPIDHGNSMLYRDTKQRILVPSLNYPHALAVKRANMTEDESDDLTIAIIRTYWPKMDNSDIGDLYKIYVSKKLPIS